MRDQHSEFSLLRAEIEFYKQCYLVQAVEKNSWWIEKLVNSSKETTNNKNRINLRFHHFLKEKKKNSTLNHWHPLSCHLFAFTTKVLSHFAFNTVGGCIQGFKNWKFHFYDLLPVYSLKQMVNNFSIQGAFYFVLKWFPV